MKKKLPTINSLKAATAQCLESVKMEKTNSKKSQHAAALYSTIPLLPLMIKDLTNHEWLIFK